MSYLAEKVGDAYASVKCENGNSSAAYAFARTEARMLGARARCSSNDNTRTPSDYPTIVYDLPDGSQAKLMYGGVMTAGQEYWHDC